MKASNIKKIGIALLVLVVKCQAMKAPEWRPIKTVKREVPKKRREGFFSRIRRSLRTGIIAPGPRYFHELLYWATAADALQFVLFNEYSNFLNLSTVRAKPSMYSKLFVFARLRPRLLFSVGALLRALQLCTPFQKVIDPSIGVGAGINLCAMLAGSRWVKPVVLGWATTKCAWVWLGARQMDRAFLPITLSIHEWEDRQKKGRKADKDDTYHLGVA